jgi:hypothetical protein
MTKNLFHYLQNIPGWRSQRKIVVLESDDWGSIRMSSKANFDSLLSMGIRVDKCPYNSNDALESNDDLELLFNALTSVKDKNGNSAVITANTIVANPDFQKIRDCNFEEYHNEILTETLKKYSKHDRVFSLYGEGIRNKIFVPQLHGREHLNISRWMNALRSGSFETRVAFDHGIFGISKNITTEDRKNFMPALDYDTEHERQMKLEVLKEGAGIFKDMFGYFSKSFIAPSYTWDAKLERGLKALNILFLQGITFQKQPIIGDSKYKKIYHYLGQKNSYGQVFLVRNAFFEPSLEPNKDWLRDCLNRISIAFHLHKPAIIGTHRLNYIGFIDENNRDNNLKALTELLRQITRKWPDVEFMSTDQLGDAILLSGGTEH